VKKSINILTSLLFIGFIAGFFAAFVLLPDRDFSEEENCSLQAFPEFTWTGLLDGTFSAEINTYFADQFPARDEMVGIKGVTETLLGKGENNGVLLGRNGQLAVRLFDMYKSRLERTPDMDYYYPRTVADSLEHLNAWAREQTVPVAVVLPPRTVDITASSFAYPTEISDALYAQIRDSVAPETGYVDLYPLLRKKHEAGEYVYLRTDHHWNACGAYLAYEEVMRSWGLEAQILPRDAFAVERIPDFYGTAWSRAGYKFVEPDTLEIWTAGNEGQFTTSCIVTREVLGDDGTASVVKEAEKTFPGWLNREKLAGKDKYAAFLDGIYREQTVFAAEETGRERLLLVKDSFANAMVPFLVQHFDLVIINLAGKVTDISSYMAEYGCDRILIVYNWANLIENNNLALLR